MNGENNEQAVVELKAEATGMQTWARSLVVASKDDADIAMERLARIKGVRARWVSFWAPLKKSANETWKGIVAKEKEGTDVIDQAEATVKTKVLTWQRAEAEKAAIEQRRLQAIEDERARKEKAKAEESARIQREKEEAARREQEAAMQRAAKAKNEAARAAAMAEAEKARQQAEQAAAKAAVKEETASLVMAPVVTMAPAVAEASGTSTRTTWKAEVVDMVALIAAAVPGSVAASFLIVDQKAADGFARATKGRTPVAGILFRASESLSVRSC